MTSTAVMPASSFGEEKRIIRDYETFRGLQSDWNRLLESGPRGHLADPSVARLLVEIIWGGSAGVRADGSGERSASSRPRR